MKRLERDKAVELRKKGYSMLSIAKELGVSKASVSLWVRDISLSKEDRAKLSQRSRSVESIERRRLSRITNTLDRHKAMRENAKQDIASLTKHELLLIGIALYWGEGAKKNKGLVGVANSDPRIIRIMMRFFKEVCEVPPNKFRAHIHTFSHLNAKTAENYWSGVSKIPLTQFYKTYSKPSSASLGKKDSLLYGTVAIYICDTALLQKIFGWIERVDELASK